MGRKANLVLILAMVLLSALQVKADPTYPDGKVYDVESNWTNWRDHTYALPTVTHEGGDPANNTYFTASARDETNWFYPYDSGAGGTSGFLVGNLWEKYGDRFIFTVDIKVETASFTLDQVYFDFYGADSGRFDETFHSVNQTTADGWITYNIVFDANWTTAEAIANGWNNRGSNDFYETYAGMTKSMFVGGRAASGDSNDFQISVDNWGFIPITSEPGVYDCESNTTNWRDHTYALPVLTSVHEVDINGIPNYNTYFTAHARGGSNWFYPYDSAAGGTDGFLVGNIWSKYGDNFIFTVDVKVETPGFTLDQVYFDFYGADSGRFDETFHSVNQTAADGWVTYTIGFDSSWTTAQAIAAGWNNRGSNDFYDTYVGMDKNMFVGGRAASGDVTPFQISVDNWGFIPSAPLPPEPNGFVVTFEPGQEGAWQWMKNGDHVAVTGTGDLVSGGNPGLAMPSNTSQSPYIYLTNNSGAGSNYFDGDMFTKYGDRLMFTADVKVLTSNVEVENFFVDIPGLYGGPWYYFWTGPFDVNDGWVTLTAPLDEFWKDDQAQLNKWFPNGGFAREYNANGINFNDTLISVNGASFTFGARPGLTGSTKVAFEFALDNMGILEADRPAPVENKGFVALFQNSDDYSQWRSNGTDGYPGRLETGTDKREGIGGNSGGSCEISRADAGNLWLCPLDSKWSNDVDAYDGALEHDLFTKYGNEIEFTVDVKVMTEGVTVNQIEYIHSGDYTRDINNVPNGEWTYTWDGAWTSADGWFTLTAPMDANWSDVDAIAKGWVSSDEDSFVDTVENTFKWSQVNIADYDPNSAGITVRIDNYGYRSRDCGDINHMYPGYDLNLDCKVDFVDFSGLAYDWLITMDINDLSGMSDQWLLDNRPDSD